MLARDDEGGKDGDGGQEVLGGGDRNICTCLRFIFLWIQFLLSVFLSVVCVCKCNLTYPGGEPALQVDLCGV
jgi:hypothetical protein